MKLNINGKEQGLSFGVGFVRELDKVSPLTTSGLTFGMALVKALPSLQTYDPSVLSDIIYSATLGNSPRVSRQDVDDYIDGIKDAKEMSKLFDDISKEVNASVPIKVALKNMKA